MIEFKPEIADAMYRSFPEYAPDTDLTTFILQALRGLSEPPPNDSSTLMTEIGHQYVKKLFNENYSPDALYHQFNWKEYPEFKKNPDIPERIDRSITRSLCSVRDWIRTADIPDDAKNAIDKEFNKLTINTHQTENIRHSANIKDGQMVINLIPENFFFTAYILSYEFHQEFDGNVAEAVAAFVAGHEMGHCISKYIQEILHLERNKPFRHTPFLYGKEFIHLDSIFEVSSDQKLPDNYINFFIEESFADFFGTHVFHDLGFPQTILTDNQRRIFHAEYSSRIGFDALMRVVVGMEDELFVDFDTLPVEEQQFRYYTAKMARQGVTVNSGLLSFSPFSQPQIEHIISNAWADISQSTIDTPATI